jgi:hypothetical protein
MKFAIQVLFASLVLTAAPITYVESGQFWGSLGGNGLTNVSFAFTFYGDTANIMGDAQETLNPALSNLITIGGFNGYFTTPVDVGYSTLIGVIGFVDAATRTSGILFGGNGIAPIYVSGDVQETISCYSSGSFATSLGTLTISDAKALTFAANYNTETASADISSVPEPSTCWMAALALAGLSQRFRSRKTWAHPIPPLNWLKQVEGT